MLTDPSIPAPTVRQTVNERPVRALILDDNRVDRMRIERLCRDAEFDISFDEAGTLHEFQEAINNTVYDLFLIDYRLGDGDGLIALDILSRHRAQFEGRVIMIAGDSQIQVAIDAIKGGCSDFLLKDHLTSDRLLRTIMETLSHTERQPVSRSAAHFANENGAEMRAILSAMLRHVRGIRGTGAHGTHVDGLETACARLWNFLEILKADDRTPLENRSLH